MTVCATFTGPDGRTITREAFWDGGSTWRLRFAPTADGRWTWRTECSADSGLDGRSGTLDCVPYTGDVATYRHGFLRVSDDRRHLAYADGTPFFYLGDTHWQMPDTERVDACNDPSHAGAPVPLRRAIPAPRR